VPEDDTLTDASLADDALLADLRRIAGVVDAPPPLLAASSRAAFAFGRLDDELARLVQDTAVTPVGARGPDEPRMIAFAADEITVDVEVTGGPHDRRLTGVVAGSVSDLTLQTPEASYRVEIDEQGRFRAAGLAGSLLRLTMATASGRGVTTPWVQLDR
jgi:hypothetical protein